MALCKVDFKLTKFSCYLDGIYGPKLTMHKGRTHGYLGVLLKFMEDGNLQVSIEKYLSGMIEGFPEMKTGEAASPAAERLFDIQD